MPDHTWTEHYLSAGLQAQSETTMRGIVFGCAAEATLLDSDVVELRVRAQNGCTGKSESVRCDVAWPQERLFDVLDQIFARIRPTAREEARARFGVPLDRAEDIVADSLHTGDFGSDIESTSHAVPTEPNLISLEHHCALTCAAESTNPSLIGWIALEHPYRPARSRAIRHSACPNDILLAVAEDASSTPDLLERTDLAPEVFDRMVEAETARYIRSTHPSEHHRTFIQFALHPACSEDLAIGLLSHAAGTAQDVDDLKTMQQHRDDLRRIYRRSLQ